jgi:hypothetical protein
MNGPFGQIFVLKTSAAQNDPFFADPFGDTDNDLGERVVESGRDPSDRYTPIQIVKNPRYHGLPINDSQGRLKNPAFIGRDSSTRVEKTIF